MSILSRHMGYDLNTRSLDRLSMIVLKSIKKENFVKHSFACANPHSLSVAERLPELKYALKASSILVTDGVGLSIAGKIFNTNVGPRITGGDFFSKVMHELNQIDPNILGRKAKVFYFGSSQKVLDLLKIKTKELYPHIDVCGTISPPFGNWSETQDQAFVDQINSAQADVLWVGMTAPKQELWTHKNRSKLNTPLIGSIGAVFDFFAGTFERAPSWASKLGIEWLFRLCKEPKRMWRRNLISPIRFMVASYLYSRYEKDKRINNIHYFHKTRHG